MVKTIVRTFHWTPEVINGLYCDDIDHFGIEYWYNDCKEVNEKLNEKTPKK
jgi:hypothetical protein